MGFRNHLFSYLLSSLLLPAIFMLMTQGVQAQRYLTDYDSALFVRDTVRPLVKRFENLSFVGYIQPQFQVASHRGIPSYEGGNFSERSNNRFMLRRARMRVDYRMPGKVGNFPAAYFTFQIEATERDVNVRDMFVRVFEPKKNNFSLTLGLFARPFGHEVNLSSAFRESPERGRMSQTLLPSERDLGAMVSYEGQKRLRKAPPFKFDIGVFNGQGKSGPAEFDSYKDIISRLSIKPASIGPQLQVSGSVSFLYGGWYQASKYRYDMDTRGFPHFAIDSSLSNIGDRAPRIYRGADIQLVQKHGWGKTELRGEYWRGLQSGSATTTVNPGVLPMGPTYRRHFDGGFFYYLQNIINSNWELIIKYDWYDPNTKAAKEDIGLTNLTPADIRYNTYGGGITHYFNANLKVLAYYAVVRNEKTSLAGYTEDLDDNVFTLRLQLRF